MKNTLYSLMLNEEVVAEVDALARNLGTTRSSLINEILAEYLMIGFFAAPTSVIKRIFDNHGITKNGFTAELANHAGRKKRTALTR